MMKIGREGSLKLAGINDAWAVHFGPGWRLGQGIGFWSWRDLIHKKW